MRQQIYAWRHGLKKKGLWSPDAGALKHARHVVYADDLDISNDESFDRLGASCRICEQQDCFHRSVPPIGKEIAIDQHKRGRPHSKLTECYDWIV
ncbi:short-chain fatty acyl-CoA regulator family protein [uncultured Sulfitobacter sp.]|uniref:short-chain fatty acyl-CoA regulator family protein n=1 Tax=uncultured Sulfitobacter sp. TaxID=191468 RepID=UPI003453E3EE